MGRKKGVVLIVDDDREIREAVAESLEEEGYATATAPDGAVALEWLQREARRPCVVLLDLMMPVMDGFELLRRVRASEDLKDLPVIITSASASTDVEGATDGMRKPFALDRLLDMVEKHCPSPHDIDREQHQRR